mmetsp:Transcript_128862/g.412630  ORF Transcript_128862/g.412630 Transcript_128862/m.412630 type:complete len:297 (-) Transcript_128862:1040-1930(-)
MAEQVAGFLIPSGASRRVLDHTPQGALAELAALRPHRPPLRSRHRDVGDTGSAVHLLAAAAEQCASPGGDARPDAGQSRRRAGPRPGSRTRLQVAGPEHDDTRRQQASHRTGREQLRGHGPASPRLRRRRRRRRRLGGGRGRCRAQPRGRGGFSSIKPNSCCASSFQALSSGRTSCRDRLLVYIVVAAALRIWKQIRRQTLISSVGANSAHGLFLGRSSCHAYPRADSWCCPRDVRPKPPGSNGLPSGHCSVRRLCVRTGRIDMVGDQEHPEESHDCTMLRITWGVQFGLRLPPLG